MSIDEADALAMEALAEEDLSDEAVEGRDPERSPGDSAVDAPVLPPPEPPPLAPGETATLIGTSLLGDTFDESTGEVLKDAPGWADGRIQTIDGLDWAGEKLSEVSAVIRENERLRDAAVERLQRRIDLLKARTTDINSPLVMRQEFFETAIRAYADAHRADILRGLRKDAKSRRFPSGLRLAWKSGGGKYQWRRDLTPADRERLAVEWAIEVEEGPDGECGMVDYRPKPILDRIVSFLKSHRERPEPPPGLEYVPEHEELSVKVGD